MKHLEDGALRRMLDEPSAFNEQDHAHASSCNECRERATELAANARVAAAALNHDASVASQSAAYDRVKALVQRPALKISYRTLGGLAAATAFVLALVFTPLGGYARAFLTIFKPQQFEPIQLSRAQLQNLHLLPQADQIGTQRVVRRPTHRQYGTLQAAQQHLDFTVLTPQALPSNVPSRAAFFIATPGEMTYTFSAAKARAFAARAHKTLPAMPPGLDGTTIRLQTADVFNASYGVRHRRSRFVEIFETRVPKVSSTGASLDTLEQYLLAMPGVPSQLADQIRALGDIENTVPVPVIVDKQTARHVTVQGVDGLAIGDNTGLGAGVLWQKNGMVYAVGGAVSMDDALAVANGLR